MTDYKHRRPQEILTEAEIRELLTQCSRRAPTGIRDRALLVVLYRAGLRISEALDLRPVDIDYDDATIRVLHGKGDKTRTVVVDDGTLAEIRVWLAARAKLGVNGRQKLFCTLQGGPLSANQVRQMCKRRARKTDLQKSVHPHALRHAYAVGMSREGMSLHTIKDQLGHDYLATTEIYLRGLGAGEAVEQARKRRPWNPGA